MSNIVYLADGMADFLVEGDLDRPKHVVAKIKFPQQIGQENAFNPYTTQVQNFIENISGIGPKILHEDSVYKFQEFIYNTSTSRADMCRQETRLWMMQPDCNFLRDTRNVPIEEYGGQVHLYHLIQDKDILGAIKRRMEGYNMQPEEMHTLEDALKCLEAQEEEFILSLFKDFPKEELYLVHGDCYYLNVLFDKNKKDLTFIDFEYSNLAPFTMDIANIANETVFDYEVTKYPNFTYSEEAYPSDDDLREMIRALMTFWDNKDLKFTAGTDVEFAEKLRATPEYAKIDAKRIESNFLEMKKAACLNNFYFVLWCFWDMRTSDIELDYILYARDRAKAYLRSKKDLLDYLRENKIDLKGSPVC